MAANAPGGADREGTPAILWVPDDDVRLLLRGILQLHHHPVVLQLTSAEGLRGWDSSRTALLVIDAASGAERWQQELAQALRIRPELRALVLFAREEEPARRKAEGLGARATLARPFALRDFLRAVSQALGAPGPD